MYDRRLPLKEKRIDIRKCSDNGNPGTWNAIKAAGMGWGILAVIFGVAAGLFPQVGPLCLLAALYIVFKILMRRRPKGGRTVLTFLCWNALNAIFRENDMVRQGCFWAGCLIIVRYLRRRDSKVLLPEQQEHVNV
ncbi:MAG TPA: glycerol-3-phosphate acyltransferase [Candidatus Eubacterium avistercoris]|uniref:Glycerol-3-phosphate acyltransferase n=1 Tax=Candidatus Eubacterium avistercoris TaxID=2838567 RepID=A0A9D2D138_9FIRM|nr:glycerol-3-phosphate acyltransferase [Candidatus Eubacterium avistercoris]